MVRFTQATYQALNKAGWFDARRIDVTSIIEGIKNEKMDVFPKLIEFLQEFGQLRVDVTINNHSRAYQHVTSFRYERGLQELHPDEITYFKRVIDCAQLAIIGYSESDWAILMDDTGILYTGDVDRLNKWGSGDSALEELLWNGNCTHIPFPGWWEDRDN